MYPYSYSHLASRRTEPLVCVNNLSKIHTVTKVVCVYLFRHLLILKSMSGNKDSNLGFLVPNQVRYRYAISW